MARINGKQAQTYRGKKVSRFYLNRRWSDEYKRWIYAPSIYFTDGSYLYFYNDSDENAGIVVNGGKIPRPSWSVAKEK